MKLQNCRKITNSKLALIIVLVTLIFAPLTSSADQNSDLEAQKAAKQAELNQLNQQIKQFNEQIAQKRQQAASLNNEISLYNTEIRSTELQIQATETNIDNTNLQITDTKQQIDQKTVQIEEEKKLIAQLIATINQYDNTSELQLSLGSQNFSDFMDQVEATQSVNGKVYDLLQQVKDIKAKLQQNEDELQVNLANLNNLHDQLNQTQLTLSDQKSAKVQLLTQTRGQESRYQKLLSQSQEQEAKINQELTALDQQLHGDKSFKSLKPIHGILQWPMDGVLSQGYGNTGFTKLGYTFHNGIDIAAAPGAEISAAADGVVYAVGTGQAAYGNWVAVKHSITAAGGHAIITLYAHMIKFVVSPGQEVKAGDLIGYEGNTGNTSRLLYGPDRGYHLHFGVFDAEGFVVNKGKYPDIYGPYEVPSGYTYNPLDFL